MHRPATRARILCRPQRGHGSQTRQTRQQYEQRQGGLGHCHTLWGHYVILWGHYGTLWGHYGTLWGHYGTLRGHYGTLWGYYGTMCGR